MLSFKNELTNKPTTCGITCMKKDSYEIIYPNNALKSIAYSILDIKISCAPDTLA